MQVGEGVQLGRRPFGMNPAQCMPTDGELPGVIAQHHGIA
jgi:hypothetical protein